MNKIKLIAIGGSLMVASGCMSPRLMCMQDPHSVPTTPNDAIKISDSYIRKAPKEKIRVAVLSIAENTSANALATNEDDAKVRSALANVTGEQIETKLQRSEWFEVVSRKNLDAIQAEEMFANGGAVSSSVRNADMAVVLRSKVLNYYGAASGGIGSSRQIEKDPNKAYGLGMETRAELSEVATKKVHLKNVYTAKEGYSKPGFMEKLLNETSAKVSSQFIHDVMQKLRPEVKVVETRGDCQFACIKPDKWNPQFSATGTPVSFYTHEKDDDGEIQKKIIGEGFVIRADSSAVWIEVKNYETVGVRVGMCVDVRK